MNLNRAAAAGLFRFIEKMPQRQAVLADHTKKRELQFGVHAFFVLNPLMHET